MSRRLRIGAAETPSDIKRDAIAASLLRPRALCSLVLYGQKPVLYAPLSPDFNRYPFQDASYGRDHKKYRRGGTGTTDRTSERKASGPDPISSLVHPFPPPDGLA